jgi:phosphotransferase system HPr (HPr) family protein
MSSPTLCTREVIVNLENGLHMSPSARIVQTAQAYSCSVTIRKGDKTVDGKSMLDVLTLAAEKGTTLVLEANGDSAQEAIDALDQLFKTNFAAD